MTPGMAPATTGAVTGHGRKVVVAVSHGGGRRRRTGGKGSVGRCAGSDDESAVVAVLRLGPGPAGVDMLFRFFVGMSQRDDDRDDDGI